MGKAGKQSASPNDRVCEAGHIACLDDVPCFYECILMDGRSSAVLRRYPALL